MLIKVLALFISHFLAFCLGWLLCALATINAGNRHGGD